MRSGARSATAAISRREGAGPSRPASDSPSPSRMKTPSSAPQRDRVQVDEVAERPVEALDEGDASGLAALDAARLRLLLLPSGDLLDEDSVLRRQRLGPQREDAPDLRRHREHPLSHGHVGQDVVDEMRRRPAHASGRARGARAPALARVRDDDLLVTDPARDATKSVRQDAAAQIATKLLLDVVGHVLAPLLAHRREKGLEVLTHDEVEGARLGTVTYVRPRLGRGWARRGEQRPARQRTAGLAKMASIPRRSEARHRGGAIAATGAARPRVRDRPPSLGREPFPSFHLGVGAGPR